MVWSTFITLDLVSIFHKNEGILVPYGISVEHLVESVL